MWPDGEGAAVEGDSSGARRDFGRAYACTSGRHKSAASVWVDVLDLNKFWKNVAHVCRFGQIWTDLDKFWQLTLPNVANFWRARSRSYRSFCTLLHRSDLRNLTNSWKYVTVLEVQQMFFFQIRRFLPLHRRWCKISRKVTNLLERFSKLR